MVILVVAGLAVSYAVVRYHVFGGVDWSELPLFVSNKGISLASVLLFALAYLANRWMPSDPAGRQRRRRLAREAGLSGFWLMVLHVAVSLGILDARNYPVLFHAAGLTTAGIVCIVMGSAATLAFAVPALASNARLADRLPLATWRLGQQVGYVALAFTSAHVLAVGAHNFTAVERWPGALPPISLISFIACLVPIVGKLASISRRRS